MYNPDLQFIRPSYSAQNKATPDTKLARHFAASTLHQPMK
jgi:hypothetical protein